VFAKKLFHVVGFVADDAQCDTRRGALDSTQYGIESKIWRETVSTGTMSAMFEGLPMESLKMPRPTKSAAP